LSHASGKEGSIRKVGSGLLPPLPLKMWKNVMRFKKGGKEGTAGILHRK